jgi:hypothetical protein
MAWGLSRLSGAGLLPTDYLDEVAKQGIRRLRKARPQHLANLAGAFASLNHASPLLLDGILVHACARGVAAFRCELSNCRTIFADFFFVDQWRMWR